MADTKLNHEIPPLLYAAAGRIVGHSYLAQMPTQPGPPTGVPMTYLYKGKQYVVVAVEGNLQSRAATQIVAFALPDPPKPAARPED